MRNCLFETVEHAIINLLLFPSRFRARWCANPCRKELAAA